MVAPPASSQPLLVLTSKSSLVAFGCFARCICNKSTLAKISGLSMLSSMSAVVLVPSGRVTVISPSLTSKSPRYRLTGDVLKGNFLAHGPRLKCRLSTIAWNLEFQVAPF